MLKHLDLCSGIGGFALGFEWAGLSRPILFCDIEPWCRAILRKHWPDVPIEKDVKELAHDPTRIPDHDILTVHTPANPSVSPGSVKAKRMTATSGRASAKLLHSKDPLGSFWKMFMVTSAWVSTKCLLTWKPKATPAGRLLFQLAASMPPTDEIASGSSPLRCRRRHKDVALFPTPDSDRQQRAGQGAGSFHSGYEAGTTLAGYAKMWPTLKLPPTTRTWTQQISRCCPAK